jgi:AAHS family 4-hydroxybenzoate transporter-like MFS transporter
MSSEHRAGVIDIGRSLDEGAWNGFQKWVLVLAALAFAVDGLANQVLGLALPALIKLWALPRTQFAPVAALGLAGVAVGAAIGGYLGDRVGRRAALISAIVLFGAVTAATVMAYDIPSLALLRTLAGIGIGGAIPNGAALIAEFTPLKRRSIAIAWGMVFIPVGGFLSSLIGTAILKAYGWRSLFLVGGALPLLVAVLFVFVLPESPRFLLRASRRKAELVRLMARFGYGFSADAEFVDGGEPEVRAPVAALFGPASARDTYGLWAGFFFCLLASYTLFSWLPTMLGSRHYDATQTSLGMTIFNFGGMVGGVACGWMLGRMGSKLSIAALAGGGAAAGLALAFFPFNPAASPLPLVALLALEGLFIGGIHNAFYTLAAHVYPPFVRATGVGSAAAVGRIGAIASSYTGVLALDRFGPFGFFASIAGALALAMVSGLIVRKQMAKVV